MIDAGTRLDLSIALCRSLIREREMLARAFERQCESYNRLLDLDGIDPVLFEPLHEAITRNGNHARVVLADLENDELWES